jgi:hypothetical protein
MLFSGIAMGRSSKVSKGWRERCENLILCRLSGFAQISRSPKRLALCRNECMKYFDSKLNF